MKCRKLIGIVLVCFLVIIGSLTFAMADTILFPVIAVNQPNTVTIISVFTRPTVSTTHLHYIYRYKDAFVGDNPNHTGDCAAQSFTRSTAPGDLVSFDASGTLNSGNALFNDPDTYSDAFSLSGSGARRAYLLVTNSNSTGTRVDVSHNTALGGDFMVMDIGSGAAWGGRGINDPDNEDYTFKHKWDGGGGIYNAIDKGNMNTKWFSFLPPDEWTTKLFVTPIGSSMDSANLSSTVRFSSSSGVYNRGATQTLFTKDTSFTCTATIDLTDMLDSTALASVNNTGGFTWLWNQGAANALLVYKLEYVLNDSTYGGTNNNGYLLSSIDP